MSASAAPRIAAGGSERDIRVECWIVHDFYHERITAEDALDAMLQGGAINPVVTVVDGFERLPEAILALYDPACLGKVQARFRDERGGHAANP